MSGSIVQVGFSLASPSPLRICFFSTDIPDWLRFLKEILSQHAFAQVEQLVASMLPVYGVSAALNISDAIESPVGIEFYPEAYRRPIVSEGWAHLLQRLVEAQRISPSVMNKLLLWPGVTLDPPTIRGFNHIKYSLDRSGKDCLKIYLGFRAEHSIRTGRS